MERHGLRWQTGEDSDCDGAKRGDLPKPSPPWLNYHVQPSGDEITLAQTPSQGGPVLLHTHTNKDERQHGLLLIEPNR